jgi:hypothetical protein
MSCAGLKTSNQSLGSLSPSWCPREWKNLSICCPWRSPVRIECWKSQKKVEDVNRADSLVRVTMMDGNLGGIEQSVMLRASNGHKPSRAERKTRASSRAEPSFGSSVSLSSTRTGSRFLNNWTRLGVKKCHSVNSPRSV